MSESHEDILASFQSITGIDLPEAIFHLEESNWDLLTAIHRVLPQDNIEQEFSAFNASHVNQNPMVQELNNLDVESNVDEIMTVPSSPSRSAFRNIYHPELSTTSNHSNEFTKSSVGDYSSMSGSSSGISSSSFSSPKELIFNIHLKYEIHKINILDTSTVADLKMKIMSVTSIPVCRQSLTGWIPNETDCTDSTVLEH